MLCFVINGDAAVTSESRHQKNTIVVREDGQFIPPRGRHVSFVHPLFQRFAAVSVNGMQCVARAAAANHRFALYSIIVTCEL